MSNLKEQFKLFEMSKPEPYWQLDFVCDLNDPDDVRGGTTFSDKMWDTMFDIELYAISFLDKNGHHYEDNPIWQEFFQEADMFSDLDMPCGYGSESVAVTLTRFDGTSEFGVEIPDWDSLFKDEADMKEKLTKANKEWEEYCDNL